MASRPDCPTARLSDKKPSGSDIKTFADLRICVNNCTCVNNLTLKESLNNWSRRAADERDSVGFLN